MQKHKMNKKKTLLVIEPTYGFDEVAKQRGYNIVLGRHIEQNHGLANTIDAVVFMGGTDISPKIYGQEPSMYSKYHDHRRDERELALYAKFKHLPKLGICRGAQLLNCLNGGELYQHVYGHDQGHHQVVDNTGEAFTVCSIHHQMMKLPSDAMLVSWKVDEQMNKRFYKTDFVDSDGIDPEVVYYEKDKALAFQAHPEFGPDTCTDYFFNLVERYIF